MRAYMDAERLALREDPSSSEWIAFCHASKAMETTQLMLQAQGS